MAYLERSVETIWKQGVGALGATAMMTLVYAFSEHFLQKFSGFLKGVVEINGAPRAKPVVPMKRLHGANIPYQRTHSPTGGTRGPLGSGYINKR